jgi:DNA-binding NtrC family response regulator
MPKGKVVLVVEQKEEIREKLAQILAKQKEYTVLIETSSKQIRDKYKEIIKNAAQIVLLVDIIIDDVIDNEIGGVNLIQELKKINPDLRGLIISSIKGAKNFTADAINLVTLNIRKGAFDYLAWPFSETELLKKLELAFDQNEAETYNYLAEKKITNESLAQILEIIKHNKAKTKHMAKALSEKDIFTLFSPDELIALLEKELGQKAAPMKQSTVLVIDDEIRIGFLVKAFLNKYNVLIAKDGAESLGILKKEPIDIILLDIKMPGTNGIDLIPKLQKINPQVDILMLTAYKDRDYAIQSIRSGAINYITKPFFKAPLNELIEQVEKIRYYKQVLPELIGRFGG